MAGGEGAQRDLRYEVDEKPPFRILASIVDDFRHQQFHGIDFVTLRISGRKA